MNYPHSPFKVYEEYSPDDFGYGEESEYVYAEEDVYSDEEEDDNNDE